MMPVEAFSDAWVKRWFALRRPFLHIYEGPSETDELAAIHVAQVRVEADENVQRMLQVRDSSPSAPLHQLPQYSI